MYIISNRLLTQGNVVKRLVNVHWCLLSLVFHLLMYWDINKILPYQRHFNFINGPREIGKTYTTLKWLINRALTKGDTFTYICRTQDEKKGGILEHATKKVIEEQFPDYKVKTTPFSLFMNESMVANCVALSESVKIKKFSFPSNRFIIFDEYMLEPSDNSLYVHGWKEPDLFLSIYHTIDRGRDSNICFLLGNNTAFYNPYHLHPAFDIPYINPGQIWKSKNVLFQWAMPSEELSNKLENTAINQQIKNTEYGKYAVLGQYVGENNMFLGHLDDSCYYQFTILYNSFSFGVFTSAANGYCIISSKIDKNCPFVYAMTLNDHTENTLLLTRDNVHLKWLGNLYKKGLVKFDSMKTKQQCNDVIRMVVR